MIRRWLFGVEPDGSVTNGAIRRSKWDRWRRTAPAWLVAIVYTARLAAVAAGTFVALRIADTYHAGPIVFGVIMALALWGYSTELIKADRRSRPGSAPNQHLHPPVGR